MKVQLPPKFKYKATSGKVKGENAISLATIGIAPKSVKMVYVDGKLFLEFPFVVDMRKAIENNLQFNFVVDENVAPLHLKQVDLRDLNVSNRIMQKLEMLPGQEQYNSRARAILLNGHNKKETSKAISRSTAGSKNDAGSHDAMAYDKEGKENDTSKIESKLNNTEKVTRDFVNGLSREQKVNGIKQKVRIRDEENLIKLNYNKEIVKFKSVIDYSSEMPNKSLKNIVRLGDEMVFGRKTKYYLGYPTNPGKRESSLIKDLNYSKEKRASEFEKGIAEKCYERAEVEAFSDEIRKEYEAADKILTEIMADSDTGDKNSISNKKIKELLKNQSNRFLKDTKLLNSLDKNANHKSLDLDNIQRQTRATSKLNVMKGVSSLDSKTGNISKAKAPLKSTASSDFKIATSQREKDLKQLYRKNTRKQTRKYRSREEKIKAKRTMQSLSNRKIDPAKLLRHHKQTHTTVRDSKQSVLSTQIKGATESISDQTTTLDSDPVNTRNVVKSGPAEQKKELKAEAISNVLVELPYEFAESQESENYDLVDQTEYFEEINNFPIVFAKQVVNRYRYIKHVVEIDPDMLENDNLYCSVLEIDKNTNVKLSRQRAILNLNSLKQQFLYPEPHQFPSFQVSKPDKNGDFNINVQNNHVININVRIYEKRFEKGKNITDNAYELSKAILLKPGEVKKFKETRTKNYSSQFRMTFSTTLGNTTVKYDNIITPDTDFEQKNKNEINVSLYTYVSNSKGIYVHVENLPFNAASVTFQRRVLDNDGGNSSQSTARFKELVYPDGEEVGHLTILNHDKGLKILDTDVKDDTEYQYKVTIFDNIGRKLEKNSYHNCHFVFDQNIVEPAFKYIGGDSNLGTYMFKIILKQDKTDIEKIIERLNDKQFELFKDKVESLTKTVQTPPNAYAYLINTKTGQEIELGEYEDGNIITFTAKKTSNYILYLKSKAINPELVLREGNRLIKYINDVAIDASVNSKRRLAIQALKEKENREIIPMRPEKFFSRKAKKGIIEDEGNLALNFNFNLRLGNFTGDNLIKTITNLRPSSFGAKPVNVLVLPTNQVMVDFKVLGKIQDVDFYFITTKKEGSIVPLTTLMSEPGITTKVTFMDFVNADYIGKIQYYVQAVFKNGSVSNPNYIGTCTVIEKKYV